MSGPTMPPGRTFHIMRMTMAHLGIPPESDLPAGAAGLI